MRTSPITSLSSRLPRRQPQLLLFIVTPGTAIGIMPNAGIPRIIRVEMAAKPAVRTAGRRRSRLLVGAGGSAVVAVLEAADPVVKPPDNSAWRGLRGTVWRRGGLAEGEIRGECGWGELEGEGLVSFDELTSKPLGGEMEQSFRVGRLMGWETKKNCVK